MSQLQGIATRLRALAQDASPLWSNVQASARQLASLSRDVEALRRAGVDTGPLLAALAEAAARAEEAAHAASRVRSEGLAWANHLATSGGAGGASGAASGTGRPPDRPGEGAAGPSDDSGASDGDGAPEGGPSMLDAALFAAAAYGEGELPSGARRISDDPAALAALGVDENMLHPTDSGFSAELFVDAEDRYVVAFRGTRVTSGEDWMNNLREAFTGDAEYYERALRLAKTLRATAGVSQVHFVGHSLGGGMAAVSAASVGARATTFNQAPVFSPRLRTLPAKERLAELVTSVQMGWDLVSRLPGSLGRVVAMNGHAMRPVKSHSIKSMISALRGGGTS